MPCCFLSEDPLTAETIADVLHVAPPTSHQYPRTSGLGSGQGGALKGSRDHFQAHRDVREIFRVVVEGARSRIDPTLTVLRTVRTRPAANAEAGTRAHSRTLEFMEMLAGIYDE